ncbi:MAG: hypothetical protein APF81_03875 [Desulfosporosinus sp. BRH_c37]|nr:MAG: hypothetical protein APF81_03875 [Desulfosporosinus sp. BRH_c37]
MNELPEKVVQLEVLRINRNIGKRCKCGTPNYVIDTDNREVHCTKCGSRVDPYDAIYGLARHYERLQDEVERLLRQRREIADYKPWLLVFRNLESHYRGKEMLPCCPECGKAFYFEHVNSWTNRRMEELRRKRDG